MAPGGGGPVLAGALGELGGERVGTPLEEVGHAGTAGVVGHDLDQFGLGGVGKHWAPSASLRATSRIMSR